MIQPTLRARSLRVLMLLLAVLLVVSPATAGDDILSTYKKRYTKDAFLSEREAALNELADTGDPKALKAFRWCVEHSEDVIAKHRKVADKAYKTLQPIMVKLSERIDKWIEEVTDGGKRPMPDMRPKFSPEDDKRLEYEAIIRKAERAIQLERDLIVSGRSSHGRLVAALPEKAQTKLETAWKKNLAKEKDWAIRAEEYRLLGFVPTDWALHIVQDAAMNEADPRALAAAIEALGGRDPKQVNPILLERLDDARWLVQVAAISAIERTPSKEGIDALVALMNSGDGRTIDDCARALLALTGAEIRADGDLWRRYWEANREAWNGPPPPKEEVDPTDPMAGIGGLDEEEKDPGATEAKKQEAGRTGFFGLDVKSRRLVYVIDVSGSMNTTDEGEKSPRVELAKEELKRSILALEDGAVFNIVFFSIQVRVWQEEMTVAGSETRRAAVDFVDGMSAGGGTATYDALKAAFDLGDLGKGKKPDPDRYGRALVDSIILLSDGMPTVGQIVDPDAIRKMVVEWNETRRIAIHTVSIGDSDAAGFMTGIAKDSGGQNVAK